MRERITVRRLFWAACVTLLAIQPLTANPAAAVTTVPVLWTAGGLSAGADSAGQSARMASDASGNIAIVSGPANARDLAVTSYTASGTLRWQRTITPALGTCVGDWVVAATNGDFIAIGHNQDSHGRPIQSTMVRYDTNGALLWRMDFSSGFFPVVGRLVVDSAGSAYIGLSATGSGLFVQKYSPSGALLWSQGSSTGGGYAIATSLALSPDETDVVATGYVSGGAMWLTAAFNTTTGGPRWEVAAPEGITVRDVVVDAARAYVTGEGVTDPGTPAMRYWLTVVAYDRATGTRLWRTDKRPVDGFEAAGLWIAMAPDGSLVVAGQANRGFLDWYTVAFESNGTVRWDAVRDGGLNTNEIPAAVLVMPDGTTVVTGKGGPNLPGGYIPGVTAGYSAAGTLLWEAFSPLPTIWATALPNGSVCATGGYDAYVACWQVPGPVNPPQPTSIVSRKAHGTAGTFDINLPLTGTAGIECRSGGASGNHQVVFSFPNAVTLSGATVTPQPGMSGTMAGGPSISPDGLTVTLNLTNVSNAQTIAITLSGVSNGTSTNDVIVPMSLLAGDSNADRTVNSGDVLQTRNRSGGGTDSGNFRSDINTDGAVNSGDTFIIRGHSGDSLP